MTKLCGFSKCLSIISFSVAFALLPAPSFALSNYKEPGWDASYTVTKTSTNTYNIHITPTSPPDKDIGIYIETGNSSTLQFSDGTRSTLLGSGGVSGTSYDYSFISTDSNYLIEFYNNTNGGFRYISPTETFPTTTPVVSNPAIVRCSDFSSSGHPLDDIRAHVPGFDSSTYGWISICDLDSQGNITLREFIVTAQPDLHLMKWIGALNNPTYPCIQLPGETWSIGYDSTGHHSIDSHLFGSSLVCPYQGGNISYDDSNVTDVDPSFTNAGYTVPQRKVPIPDYSNTMTMSFSLSDKHLEYWNTTPNLPEDGKHFCRYLILDNTAPISDFTANCHDVQKFDFPKYGTYQLQLEIDYDKNGDGIITPDLESVGVISHNISVDGSSYNGIFGSGWNDDGVYENCSKYGWDIAKRLSCEIKNISIRIRDLFIPKPQFFNVISESMSTWGQAHLGMFYQFLAWLTTTFHDAFLNSTNVICNHDFGTFFGSHFVLNQCIVEQTFPQMWGVITLVVRSTAVFAVLLMWYDVVRFNILKMRELKERQSQ